MRVTATEWLRQSDLLRTIRAAEDGGMTKANKFTRTQERKIYEVGRKIEEARLARRLSVRGAAAKTVTSSQSGRMTEATWRRVERGFTQTNLGNITYRPSGATLMAMAEVVGLDGEALCKELGLEAPPPAIRRTGISEIEEIRTALVLLSERLAQFEKDAQ